MKRRFLELLGLLLVGDGVLSVVAPKRHCLLWEIGPESYRDFVNQLVQHPTATRWIGASEALVGMWLASRQEPSLAKRALRG